VWTVNGASASTFSGALSLTGGTLVLDYANLATPTNLLNPAIAVNAQGGVLTVRGKAGEVTGQTFGNVTVGAGASRIEGEVSGGGTLGITLGTITATANFGGLAIKTPAGVTVTTTSAPSANGLYSGRVVHIGPSGVVNFATSQDSGPTYTIGGFTGYSDLPATGSVATTNYLVNGTLAGGVTASQSVNALKLTDSGASGSLNIGTGVTLGLTSGGILYDGRLHAQRQPESGQQRHQWGCDFPSVRDGGFDGISSDSELGG
jgi:hypothetical protein